MNLDSLHLLRKAEMELILNVQIKDDSKILEIGSGTGFQLNLLKKKFKNVIGVDIANGTYSESASNDVLIYDGRNIPFAKNSFDLVFSSNALEHIKDLEEFEKEIIRVLAIDGIVIHILPTLSWKLLTLITHPLWLFKRGSTHFLNGERDRKLDLQFIDSQAKAGKSSLLIKIVNFFSLKRHGERGNYLTEFYLFTEFAWKKHFHKTGWEVVDVKSTHITYSGNQVLPSLKMKCRRKLSSYLGSASKAYFLKKR